MRRRMLAVADLGALGATALTAGLAYGSDAALTVMALTPAWLLVAKVHDLYDRDHSRIRHVTFDELGAIFYWVTLSLIITVAALAAVTDVTVTAAGAAAMWLAAFATALSSRAGMRALWTWIVPPDRVLILGDGPIAESVRRKLALSRGHHVELVDAPEEGDRDLGEATTSLGIDRIVLARDDLDEPSLAGVIGACRESGSRLSVVPPLRGMLGTAVSLNYIAELPVVEFQTWDPARSTAMMKRAIDLAGAATALVVIAPLMLVIAAAIRLTSPGPALFVQLRAGKDGVPFRMLKFRTMVSDAEEQLGELLSIDELSAPMFKLRSDPRVTKVGRLLRRTSLDELPQFFNVLRGEMSLVGPRPEEARIVERYGPEERFRLEVRPGMTGPMQVHGRGELTFAERLAVEREYIDNYMFSKDLAILLETLIAVFRRSGAY